MSGLLHKTVLENGVLPSERGYAHLEQRMLFQMANEHDARANAETMGVGGGEMGAFTSLAWPLPAVPRRSRWPYNTTSALDLVHLASDMLPI